MKTLINWIYWIAVFVFVFFIFGLIYTGDQVIPSVTGRAIVCGFYGIILVLITLARNWLLSIVDTINKIIEKELSK